MGLSLNKPSQRKYIYEEDNFDHFISYISGITNIKYVDGIVSITLGYEDLFAFLKKYSDPEINENLYVILNEICCFLSALRAFFVKVCKEGQHDMKRRFL